MEISGCNLNTHWKWQTQPGWIARQALECTAACNYKCLFLYLLSEPSQRIFDERPDSHETGNWKCLPKLVLIRDLLLGGDLRGGEALSFWQGVVLHGLPYGHSGWRAEEGHPLGCHAHSENLSRRSWVTWLEQTAFQFPWSPEVAPSECNVELGKASRPYSSQPL